MSLILFHVLNSLSSSVINNSLNLFKTLLLLITQHTTAADEKINFMSLSVTRATDPSPTSHLLSLSLSSYTRKTACKATICDEWFIFKTIKRAIFDMMIISLCTEFRTFFHHHHRHQHTRKKNEPFKTHCETLSLHHRLLGA